MASPKPAYDKAMNPIGSFDGECLRGLDGKARLRVKGKEIYSVPNDELMGYIDERGAIAINGVDILFHLG
ncbi:hypothetical protein [Chitinibacter sp. S2-10]|uniref:hypothetical protein n=1 Tax=Chitinibacter sp. S2-10 TaxID=3373597 RepID=UPI0039778193